MMTETHATKDLKQKQAYLAWQKNGYRGLIAGCTGFGKSRLGTWAAAAVAKIPEPADVEKWGHRFGKVLLVVPTEELRDNDWPAEFEKWGYADVMKNHVKAVCYASLTDEDCRDYHVVIFDEFHHMTKRMFDSCHVENAALGGTRVIMLSATEPKGAREKTKVTMMKTLGGVVYKIDLDEAAELGLVSDYKIVVLDIELDDTDKYIEAGPKDKRFMTTEKKHHEYLKKILTKLRIEAEVDPKKAKSLFFFEMKYNQFIYNLKSKQTVAERVMKDLVAKGRTLIFAGSIAQCEALCGEQVYHSKVKEAKKEGLLKDRWLSAFRKKEISWLGAVDALNEGVNIPEIDYELIAQCDSNPRKLVQRVGRGVRFREGHKAWVVILCALGTADESWVSKSLAPFDREKIIRKPWKTAP